jgi:hypothetical protein
MISNVVFPDKVETDPVFRKASSSSCSPSVPSPHRTRAPKRILKMNEGLQKMSPAKVVVSILPQKVERDDANRHLSIDSTSSLGPPGSFHFDIFEPEETNESDAAVDQGLFTAAGIEKCLQKYSLLNIKFYGCSLI